MEWLDVFFGNTQGIVGTILCVLAVVIAVAFVMGYVPKSPYVLGVVAVAGLIGFMLICYSAGVITFDWNAWEEIGKTATKTATTTTTSGLIL